MRNRFLFALPLVTVLLDGAVRADCLGCHPQKDQGFAPGHAFGSQHCETCHRGDPAAAGAEQGHRGLIAFPGDLASAGQSCGGCHAEQVRSVSSGFMATGKGMVSVSRYAFGEQDSPSGTDDTLSTLGRGPADSLLRKLCASCHLGQPKKAHAHEVVSDRGGGCAACHVNAYPGDAHPALTRRVEDGRCFGCHSRSSRIALSYAGLAEILPEQAYEQGGGLARLGDGRLLARLPADVHHRAGMACIDCHTGRGLMASARGLDHQEQAVDIACADCHANANPRVSRADLPPEDSPAVLPFSGPADQPFLATADGTPLWHVEVRPDGNLLHLKILPGVLSIPPLDPRHHPGGAHDRLACTACHSSWAPQCNGCHLSYEPDGEQWDHSARRMTPGRWTEARWDFRQAPPALGVDSRDRIAPFVPGMILRIDHPDEAVSRFRRLFAPVTPHTTGRSRACASCHGPPQALGLGGGVLSRADEEWVLTPDARVLADGLPADAWTGLGAETRGEATREGARPLNREEILRVLEAPIGGR
ncbi:MAG: hypothetical protein PVF91_03065 [Chromatiales bacterium]|jgi:hypothetical protein